MMILASPRAACPLICSMNTAIFINLNFVSASLYISSKLLITKAS
jgi:hypothetical protein